MLPIRAALKDPNAEVENIFKQHYLASLNGSPPFIRLESEDHGFVNWYTRAILMLIL